MGTNSADQESSERQGLIPRFIFDLFENLKEASDGKKEATRTWEVSVSFLEIYGEEVYDLLSNATRERHSLAVRENEAGSVFVQGQQEVSKAPCHVLISKNHLIDSFLLLAQGARRLCPKRAGYTGAGIKAAYHSLNGNERWVFAVACSFHNRPAAAH